MVAKTHRDTEATEHSGPRLVSREYAAVWQKRIFRTRAKCYQWSWWTRSVQPGAAAVPARCTLVAASAASFCGLRWAGDPFSCPPSWWSCCRSSAPFRSPVQSRQCSYSGLCFAQATRHGIGPRTPEPTYCAGPHSGWYFSQSDCTRWPRIAKVRCKSHFPMTLASI